MKVTVGTGGRAAAWRLVERLLGLQDPAAVRERDGRIAAAMFLLLAVYSAVVTGSVAPSSQRGVQFGIVLVWAASAAMCAIAPWPLLPSWAVHVPGGWAVLLLAFGHGAAGGVLSAYTVGYALVFGYVGLTGRPSTTLTILVLAEAGLLPAAAGDQDSGLAVVAAAIVVSAAVGQVVALAMAWNRSALGRLRRLRRALGELVATRSEAEAAGKVADAAVRILDADEAMVVLTEHPGSAVFVCRGMSGTDRPVADVRIDTTREPSGAAVAARSGLPLFIADAVTSPVVAHRLVVEFGVASVLYLPIPGEGGVMGAIVAWWTSPRRSLDPFAQQVAELLPAPAGQVLQRLRHAGQLDAAAMRDQLTGVGNRRRFDAGLIELPVGGVVLLFDLDSFKNINSLHGLDAGDETLRAFAGALRRSVREDDVVARFGGDEFGVILPVVTSPIAGGIIIERLQRIWRSPHGCRFSVGIAIRSADETPADTLARAETDLAAMKRLKQA